MKASELAAALGGTLAGGPEDITVSGMSTLSEAGAHDVAFITDKKFLAQVAESRAGLIITSKKLPLEGRPHIAVENVWAGVLAALRMFYPNFARRNYRGVHATAVLEPSVKLGDNVSIGPHAVAGANTVIGDGSYVAPGVVIGADCVIGRDVIIYANAVIEDGGVLGDGVIIQPGAVIGADGFKYEMLNGRWTKIPQVGHVEVQDHAEVGANSCIDRASYSVTVVGANSKIDNLVQMGHNTKVGRNCVIVAQTGVAGSSTVGDNSILAAQVGVADNIEIGEQAVLMARTGVISDLPGHQTYWGLPATPYKQEARMMAARRKLPELAAEVTRLAKRVAELERLLQDSEEVED